MRVGASRARAWVPRGRVSAWRAPRRLALNPVESAGIVSLLLPLPCPASSLCPIALLTVSAPANNVGHQYEMPR